MSAISCLTNSGRLRVELKLDMRSLNPVLGPARCSCSARRRPRLPEVGTQNSSCVERDCLSLPSVLLLASFPRSPSRSSSSASGVAFLCNRMRELDRRFCNAMPGPYRRKLFDSPWAKLPLPALCDEEPAGSSSLRSRSSSEAESLGELDSMGLWYSCEEFMP